MAALDAPATALIQQLIAAIGPITQQGADDSFRRASMTACYGITITKAQILAANAAVAAGQQALTAPLEASASS